MIRSVLSKFVLAIGIINGVLVVSGCGDDGASRQEAAGATGTLSLPLLTHTGNHTYRLEGMLEISSPTVYMTLDLGGDAEVASVELPTGVHTAYLWWWSLTRDDGNGNFVPVVSELTSSNWVEFDIFNQTTTSVSFQFTTNQEDVVLGAGRLNVNVDVMEPPAACTPFGSDCPAGTWCAPGELTGAIVKCVAEGPVAIGSGCNSPLECAAGSSCFDFGTGAACTALCASTDFRLPCAGGGTCTAQGTDYGVCQP